MTTPPRARPRLFGLPALAAALLLPFLASCGDDGGESMLQPEPIPGPGDYEREFVSGDRTRKYEVHVPPGADVATPTPVVLLFHGVPRTEGGMRRLTGIEEAADARGLVVVYPLAAPFVGDWAVGCELCTRARGQGIDDVRYVRDLLDQLGREIAVGPVYAAGYSQGGLMAFEVACRATRRIDALVTVEALMLERQVDDCDPDGPVTTLMIHGTDDPQFPWEGREGELETSVSAQATMDFWRRANGCAADPSVETLPDTEDDGTTVDRLDWPGCAGGVDMRFYRIDGGGHPWPGAPVRFSPGLGTHSRELDASAVVVEFLAGL